MLNLLLGQDSRAVAGAVARGGDLWLPVAGLEAVSGWTLKPEGACYGDACVPLPAGDRAYVSDGLLNFSALWRRLGRPFASDATGANWIFGEGHGARQAAMATLEAPAFNLPDLSGRMHALSDFLGRKVFIAFWSSW